ncbi:MAG TPA: helix-turn-helix transcriptional regulator [Chryseolinea sp.]|nr:helix-turn-helix transcriptional regulator [Chryseolinea sp.]
MGNEISDQHSSELLKGTLQIIILKMLSDNPRMYGYEITQRVRELSQETILLTEGSLYPTLHRLVAEGFLKTETVPIGKRIRKYYSLTKEGKKSATSRVEEFMSFVRTMSLVLNIRPGSLE